MKITCSLKFSGAACEKPVAIAELDQGFDVLLQLNHASLGMLGDGISWEDLLPLEEALQLGD